MSYFKGLSFFAVLLHKNYNCKHSLIPFSHPLPTDSVIVSSNWWTKHQKCRCECSATIRGNRLMLNPLLSDALSAYIMIKLFRSCSFPQSVTSKNQSRQALSQSKLVETSRTSGSFSRSDEKQLDFSHELLFFKGLNVYIFFFFPMNFSPIHLEYWQIPWHSWHLHLSMCTYKFPTTIFVDIWNFNIFLEIQMSFSHNLIC